MEKASAHQRREELMMLEEVTEIEETQLQKLEKSNARIGGTGQTSGGGCVESIHAHSTVFGSLPSRGVGTVDEGARLKKLDSSREAMVMEKDMIDDSENMQEELEQQKVWYEKVAKASTPEEIHAVLSEIYSPRRVTALLPHEGILPGFAMDLTTNDENGNPWDFDKPEQIK